MTACGTFETIRYAVNHVRYALKNGRTIVDDADKILPAKVLDVEFGKRDPGHKWPIIAGLRSRTLQFRRR